MYRESDRLELYIRINRHKAKQKDRDEKGSREKVKYLKREIEEIIKRGNKKMEIRQTKK